MYGLSKLDLIEYGLHAKMLEEEAVQPYTKGISKDRVSCNEQFMEILECLLCQNIVYKPEECEMC